MRQDNETEGLSRRAFLQQTTRMAAALSTGILPTEIFSMSRTTTETSADVKIKLTLAGDTMLGRGVADALGKVPPQSLFSEGVVEAAREGDLFVLNLECCISTRGAPWPAPGKPFFFRAPPVAVEALLHLGVDCVTLANNHALDFGYEALLDTLEHLDSAGIRWVGAGPDLSSARAPVLLDHAGFRLAVVGVTDHPRDFAALPERPGVAFMDLRRGVPDWLLRTLAKFGAGEDAEDRAAGGAGSSIPDAVLLTPHWGPNMTVEPPPYVREAAGRLREHVTLIAGHSAHVFHGLEQNVLYDMGDLIDDYARDAVLRNDLGMLFLVTLDGRGPLRLEAIPLKLEYCHTRLAQGEDAEWIKLRFRTACRLLGTEAVEEGDRLVVSWPQTANMGS
jgi:poly-gamma-glutamate capsule biosynthesis protein CapA/YwtB (metallophosphatase superfamily)